MPSLRTWIKSQIDLLAAFDYEALPEFDSLRAALLERAMKAGKPELVALCEKRLSIPVLMTAALAETKRRPAANGPLTVQQAAERLNISPRKVYALCARGELRHSKHPMRILPADLDAYHANARQEPTSKLALRYIQ